MGIGQLGSEVDFKFHQDHPWKISQKQFPDDTPWQAFGLLKVLLSRLEMPCVCTNE